MSRIVKVLVGCLLTTLSVSILTAPGIVLAQREGNLSIQVIPVDFQTENTSNPASMVVFSGNNEQNAGYIPGETVHVDVKSPTGEFLNCDATVDQSGAWSCSVNLWQYTQTTGTFYYKARGLQSGVSYTGSFVNNTAIKSVKLYINDQEVAADSEVSIASVIDAKILVNSSSKNFFWGSTIYQIQQRPCDDDKDCTWVPVYTSDCIVYPEPDLTEPVVDQQFVFNDVFDQTITGASYYFMFTTFSDGNCRNPNGGQWYYSDEFRLVGNQTFTSLNCTKIEQGGLESYACEALVKYQSSIASNPSGVIEFSLDQTDAGLITPVTCTLTPTGSGTAGCSAKFDSYRNGTFRLRADFISGNQEDEDSSSEWLPVTFASTKPLVLVKANSLEKTYGENDPALTFTYLPSDRVIQFTGSLSRSAGEDAGDYAIEQGSLDVPGYTIQFVPAALKIRKAQADIHVEAFEGIYDGEAHGLTGSATGVKGEDLSSLLAFGSSYNDVPGGITSWIFKGNANYMAYTAQMISVSISPREITVAADVLSKIYGDEDPVFSYNVTDGSLAEGDEFTGSITRQADEDAGMYMLERGSLSAGENYRIVFISSWFRIDKRPITVAADPQRKEIGMADPALTFRITEGELVNGDMFSGSIARSPGDFQGVFPIGPGSLYLSYNYELAFTGSTFAIYQPSADLDEDFDGVANISDNCVFKSNADQMDDDKDGFGNVCDTTPVNLMASMIVPVTGSSATSSINCSGDTILSLEGGDYVSLQEGLCNLTAILGMEAETSLPAPIPPEFKFVSALNLSLLDGKETQEVVGDPAGITYSHRSSAEDLDSSTMILFWDTSLKGGVGDWVELPACPVDIPVSLYKENTAEERMILNCEENKEHKRLMLTTNFPGLIVFVTK